MQASAVMPDSEMAAQWECEACTLINEADWDRCDACDTPKSGSSASFFHSHCSVCHTPKPLNPTRPPPPTDEATLKRFLEKLAASEKVASKGNGGNVGGPGFDDDVPDYF